MTKVNIGSIGTGLIATTLAPEIHSSSKVRLLFPSPSIQSIPFCIKGIT